ncbi:MAG: BrnA antitoxin family protein [Rhodobacterales bacterium]|nr:BrnA antitoxin family protein [Rhodobacterales bacterium]
MVDDGPKRLSIAEKRALANPLVLKTNDRIEELPVEALSSEDWANVDLPEQTRKKLISLRVDPEVLEFFKAQGPGYQTRMNAVLTAYMQVKKEMGQA